MSTSHIDIANFDDGNEDDVSAKRITERDRLASVVRPLRLTPVRRASLESGLVCDTYSTRSNSPQARTPTKSSTRSRMSVPAFIRSHSTHSPHRLSIDASLSSRNTQPSTQAHSPHRSGISSYSGFSEQWPPNVIVQQRDGHVLGKAMVLKTDHFPAGEIKSFGDVHITGAINFRRVANEPLYGVGQPALYTIRTILNLLQGKQVRWICLREEPVVYINSRPFVLRELQHPFRNIKDLAGIDWRRLESIESRLKLDVLRESELHSGNLLVHDEVCSMQTRACWEAVTNNTVHTSREVYDALNQEGYKVKYSRVPITPESVFNAVDIDHLVRVFLYSFDTGPNGVFVFNCQAGRGRSTLGLIVMRLLLMHHGIVNKTSALSEVISSSSSSDTICSQDSLHEEDGLAAYRRGEYHLIRRLMRVIEHGHKAKSDVDHAIDACGQVHHVRLAILEARMAMETASEARCEKKNARRAALRIERYFLLICFAAYLRTFKIDDTVTLDLNNQFTFSQYMQQNCELDALVHRFERDEAQSAFVPTVRGGGDTMMSRPVLQRQGALLGKNMILKTVFFSITNEAERVQVVEGAPNFRTLLPELPLVALGQCDGFGLNQVLDTLAHLHGDAGHQSRITWINLCSEPTIFVGAQPFVLRDYFHSFRPLSEFNVGLTSKRLCTIERRLKSDIHAEITRSNGTLLIHQETAMRKIRPHVITIDGESTVHTTDEIFDELNVHLVRVPMKAHRSPEPRALNTLLDAILTAFAAERTIVFNCQMGRGRSTTATVVALLALMHTRHLDLRSIFPVADSIISSSIELEPTSATVIHDELIDEVDTTNDSTMMMMETRQRGCKAILSLTRLLKHGRDVVNEVNHVIDLSGRVHHLRDIIYESRLLWETARETSEQSESELDKCVQYLERYAYLICINSFMHDRFKQKIHASITFDEWLSHRAEILVWFDNVRKNPLDSLTLPTLADIDEHVEVIETRCGNVLVPVSILKCDYFPGAQSASLKPKMDGAPNFRVLPRCAVVGTAVPTEIGVRNVIAAMNTMYDSAQIIWTNLREEPLLYINSKPYVLRDADNPYENLQHTGITARRLEAMEKQLKKDALAEAKRYDGRILLHDESEDGNLISFWVDTLTPNSVLTPREMFSRSLQDESHVNRIPITDEQAPLPSTFDAFVSHLLKTRQGPPKKYVFAFNCQMGRGRTTTGMIVAVLINLHSNDTQDKTEDCLEKIRSFRTESHDSRPQTPLAIHDNEETTFLNGDYKVVQALIRVLKKGPSVKAQTDAVIDMCSAMQNLRTAIYDMRVRAETAVTQHMRTHNNDRAKNYLIRYVLLIAFNSFLWECADCDSFDKQSFENWIDERPEVTNLLRDVRVV